MRYRAFISYSHADRKWARWLHRALESYRLPKNLVAPDAPAASRRLTPIFRDRDELPSSPSLSSAVNEALENSEKLIVICSPAAAASRWVNAEIRAFRRLGRADRVLCLVVAGEPGGSSAECFPPALTESDTQAGPAPEPIAADARPAGDGRRNALMKIVAGMLGVGFDALKQRDLRHRQQRLVAITAGSLTVAALTIALAITATIARQDAEFRRTQAEDLVDFMLGDLTERLHEIGRLDIYDSVGDQALEYFAAQRDDDDSDRTLAQRARNLRQIGEVRMDQANLAAALEAFEESLLITTRLAERNRSDGEAQIGLANSHFFVGHVHFLQGNLAAARNHFEQVLPIVNGLSAREPENTQWLMEVGFANTNLGRVLELEGALEDALIAYENVMVANRRLVALEPENEEWDLEVGFAHNNIGKLVIGLGRLDDAESHYRADVEAKIRVLEANPNHNLRRSYLGVSQYFLGELLVDRGKFEEGEARLQEALAIFRFLLGVDPEQTSWQLRRANIERELGRLHLSTARLDAGRQYLQTSIRTLQSLSQSDAANAGWRRDLVRTLIVSADYETRLGNLDAARRQLAATGEHLAVLDAQESANRDTNLLSIYAAICTASVAKNDNRPAAEASLRDALERLELHFPEPLDPHVLELKVRALTELNRSDESRVLLERLRAMEYRAHAS